MSHTMTFVRERLIRVTVVSLNSLMNLNLGGNI